MAASQTDLWDLVRGQPSIDPTDLASALNYCLQTGAQDFRTRVLIRDAFHALATRWGPERSLQSLEAHTRDQLKQILLEDLGKVGFPSLGMRMNDKTEAKTILSFLRDLGSRLSEPARIEIGGSCALILIDRLHRATDDIDIVDEVPKSLRVQHELLDEFARRYGLRLTHFQSHYLPDRWQSRLHSLDRFGMIDAYLVDAIDIFVGKLFSQRTKDLDDLRVLEPKMDNAIIIERIQSAGQTLLSEKQLRENAERNWYVLFGESLPV